MLRAFFLIVTLCGVIGCSDPSDPENAPPNYPDTTDPSQVMGGPPAEQKQPGAPQ